MRANLLLKTNIDTLLKRRGQTRKDLAFWCGKGESWISKIFTNANREIPLKHLDRIADFFGLATYQLFQPGISPLTERRSGKDRRSDKDRRISKAQRIMMSVATEIDTHRQQKGPSNASASASIERLFAELQGEFNKFLRAHASGETPRAGPPLASPRARARDAARPNSQDPKK